jgi:hypothetical protein
VRRPLLSPRGLLALVAAPLAVAGVLALSPPAAAEKKAVTVQTIDYKGWKNNLKLTNGDAELIVTLDVGPRVISYRAGGKNVFKEYEDQLGKSGEKDWQIRGGHRFWVGPEDLTRTYSLDNGPVKYQELDGGGVKLIQAPETEYGIQKEIEIKLAPSGTKVTVLHRITNIGSKETELAPWALSVMAPGGVEVIPLPPHKPHPGSPKNARSPADFAPNETMVLWPFFDFKDPRWTFGSKYVTLRQDNKKGPTKIGLAHKMGWVGYLNDGQLFVKRFEYQEGKTYPDNGVNFETFTNEDMLEMESLGPVVKLAPGKTVEHVEQWEIATKVAEFKDEADIDKNVLPHVGDK